MKRIIAIISFLICSNCAVTQSLFGYPIYDYLMSAVHPNGCDPNYVTGMPNDSIWVNFNDYDKMTGNFRMRWVDRPAEDLLLETGYNTSNYYVRLLLTTGFYSVSHHVLVGDWTQITDTSWHYVPTNCIPWGQAHRRFILLLDFQAHFGLTAADTITGIEIVFLNSSGMPDLAGAYIIQAPSCDTVHLGPDTSLCNGENLLLNATKLNSTYLWQDNSTNPTYNVTLPGTYWVKVTEPICTSSDTIVISNAPGPMVTNNPMSNAICTGESTNIMLTSNVPGTNFHWTSSLTSGNIIGFSADSGIVINQTLVNQLATPGIVTYHITPKVGSCSGIQVDFLVTVNPEDSAKVSIVASVNNICTGTSVTFTATATNGGTAPVYQWYKGSTPVGTNSDSYSYIPVNGDVIKVVMTSTPASCLTGSPATSNAITMMVNPILPASATIAANANPICAGISVTFTATPTNGGTAPVYQWYKGLTPVGSNLDTYSYNPVNGDMITVVMNSNASPCLTGSPATSNAVTMTVNPLLPASVTIAGDANPVCAGTSVKFTATPINGGTTPVYQWYKGLTPVGSNSDTYSYVPFSGDMITVVMTSNASPCLTGSPATSNAIIMMVNPLLPTSVTITASANPVCAGISVTFTATPVNGGTTPFYQWKVNGINAGTDSPSFSYIPQTGDSIRCIMTSNLACVSNNPASSNKIVMTASSVPVVTFTLCFDSITTVNAKPIKLKGGIPLGGTYSGPGVNSLTGVFTPSVTGIGTKTITYSYTNVALCSASKTKTIIVQSAPAFTCGNNLTDIRAGKVYPTLQLGSQCWMAADLDYGVQIPETSHQRDNCIPEKYKSAVGSWQSAVYQWDEMMQYEDIPGLQGMCPPGWHLPSETEWQTLFSNWTNNGFAGAPLKYTGYSGFNALMSGVIHMSVQWDYQNIATFFWSSTPYGAYKAWAHGINDYDPSVAAYPSSRANAFSIRCLKD